MKSRPLTDDEIEVMLKKYCPWCGGPCKDSHAKKVYSPEQVNPPTFN